MGEEVKVVAGITDEQLRLAVLEQLAGYVNANEPLGRDEFTVGDVMARFGWSRGIAVRELAGLVDEGILVCAWRIDPRIGKKVRGYRFADRQDE